MRLAGGSRARAVLSAPKGAKTRPTGAKVREAMFAILAQRVEGARVLDLFAGSGALGLEAMSRGAASVVFVDDDANAVMTIRRNAVRVIGDTDSFRIMPMQALRALRALRGTFDIVLVDPPYERGALDELRLMMQKSLLSPEGIAVLEHASSAKPDLPDSLEVVKRAKYGDTSLTFAVCKRGKGAALQSGSEAAVARAPRERKQASRTRRA
ncbi:MAG: 16S rRNA (guanine(966)-N(2))-methyltransferase RsmD [Candidatus Eremiobacteraeota bacterium]|nr:16S rRNA (guanine(966)-N(2))-methyltransferase RsmD [Candidatus Eremiobacteraeota bacterium]MBV8223219.1 16S rRNA (guanine(966)-N(2))-methyltransferase RsmD [Candidatus Eremiobacteraeota bacterium]